MSRQPRAAHLPEATFTGAAWAAVVVLLLSPYGCQRERSGQPGNGAVLAQQRPLADQSCTVSQLSDGDSFVCSGGMRVRMIGIDAPEMSQRPFGQDSRRALLRLMPIGSEVRLELDRTPADKYGRTLAYVWKNDTLINLELVSEGYALAQSFPPNTRRQKQLDSAMQVALRARRGLWKTGGFDCRPQERRQKKC